MAIRLSTATVSEIEIELRRLNSKSGYAEPLPSWLRGRGTQHRAIEDFVGELLKRILPFPLLAAAVVEAERNSLLIEEEKIGATLPLQKE